MGTLLDVGCASGQFGGLLKERGVVVWGIEPVKQAAANARRILDKVIDGFFDERAPLPNAFFDVVTFNDSLEHFPEPMSPLRLAKQKLKQNGILVCSIPNVRYVENIKQLLLNKDWEYTDKGILDDTHLRFFIKKSVVRTIEAAGYELLGIHGVNPYAESGWKTKWILPLLGPWAEDMKYYEFVVVAKPRHGG
jgi:SAM-dependent methyltransferase